MRPTLLASTIEARFKSGVRRPLFVEGSPGLGKTQIPRQVAQKLGVGFQSIHVPTLQPEDCGLPMPNKDRTQIKFIVPGEKLPFEDAEAWPDEGILVLDELAQADNALQKIAANLLQEREMHGHKLKPGWMIIATGNRTKDRAGANRILSHLSNRMTRVTLEPNLDDWCSWALDNGVRAEVIQFLRFRSGLLSAFDPQEDISPTPRAWAEGVSPALGVVPHDAEFETFKGDVGEGAAGEFLAFLDIYRKLPDPDVVLLNPDKHPVPTEPAVLYAMCGALAHRASDVNADRILTYGKRMPPEFTVLLVRDAVQKSPKFAQTRAFSEWATKEGAKVLT